MSRSRILKQLMLTALTFAPFATASSLRLFERATCPQTGYNQCAGSGLPSDFCCPPGDTCLALAGSTTVLCCPANSDCSTIKTITCDIQFQNITKYPTNLLKTIALTSSLPTCGTECCPFGYSCNSAGNCAMNSDQSAKPASPSTSVSNPTPTASPTGTLSVVPTSSSSPSSSPSSRPSSGATTSASSSQTTSPSQPPIAIVCDRFPVDAVLVGFFPGLVLGAGLAAAIMCLLGLRKNKTERRRSGSSFGNMEISEPRLQNDELRTDFLRKQFGTPSTAQNSSPTRRNTIQRMKGLFRKSTNMPYDQPASSPVPPMPLNIRKPMGHEERPVTPVAQRDPSFEDIDIYADGGTASALRERERTNNGAGLLPAFQHEEDRTARQTRFSDLMRTARVDEGDLAGLPKGKPYVYKGYSPGRDGR